MAKDRHFEGVMREQIRAINAGDSLTVANLFTEEGRFVDMSDPHAAHVGRDSIRLLVDSFIQEHDLGAEQGDSRIAVARMVSHGSLVVSELHFDCRFVGPGAPSGGVRLEWDAAVVDEFDSDGLIIEERSYSDSAAIARQLDVYTQPGHAVPGAGE